MNENVIKLPVRTRPRGRMISTAAFAKEPPDEFLDRLERLLFDCNAAAGPRPLAEVVNFVSLQPSFRANPSESKTS